MPILRASWRTERSGGEEGEASSDRLQTRSITLRRCEASPYFFARSFRTVLGRIEKAGCKEGLWRSKPLGGRGQQDPRPMVRAVYAIGGALDWARFDLDPVLVDTIEADYDVVAVVRLARGAALTHRAGVTRIEAEGHRVTALSGCRCW